MVIKKLDRIAGYAYSTKETVYNTYALAKRLDTEGIKGDLVECGVAAGAQLMAMRLACPTRWIWGFDSFEGIPMAGEQDEEQPGIGAIRHDQTKPLRERLVSSGITVHSVEQVERNFEQVGLTMDRMTLVKGWFQDTLPEANKVRDVALLRLDGDLYESTMTCLEWFYPRLVEGGVIIVDDYALSGCRKAVREFFGSDLPERIIKVEGGGGVVFWFK